MPSYKLCYFGIRGRAEMIRYMFAEKDEQYEDCRYTMEEWPKHKPTMPFGHVPVLYVDGVPLAHSRAILRYLSAEFGMNGGDNLSAAKNDVWVEVFIEALLKLQVEEKDEKTKAAKIKEIVDMHVTPMFKKMEEEIKSSGGPYLFGKDPQTADFAICGLIRNLEPLKIEWECYSTVKTLVKSFEERPKIAAWFAKRPVTEY